MSEDTTQQPTTPASSQPPAEWQYNPQEPDDDSTPSLQPTVPAGDITWTASEFVAHHKDIRWYLMVVIATLALAIIVRLLTRDNISTAMVVIVGVFFCAMAARKPRTLPYAISKDGVTIGDRSYPFTAFRSFSIVPDGPFNSIELVPMKRFMPLTVMYCDPESEEAAVNLIAGHVPYEERTTSIIDAVARRIRF